MNPLDPSRASPLRDAIVVSTEEQRTTTKNPAALQISTTNMSINVPKRDSHAKQLHTFVLLHVFAVLPGRKGMSRHLVGGEN